MPVLSAMPVTGLAASMGVSTRCSLALSLTG